MRQRFTMKSDETRLDETRVFLVSNLCGLDSPQLAANVVIPAHAGIQWFVRGHRLSPV